MNKVMIIILFFVCNIAVLAFPSRGLKNMQRQRNTIEAQDQKSKGCRTQDCLVFCVCIFGCLFNISSCSSHTNSLKPVKMNSPFKGMMQ